MSEKVKVAREIGKALDWSIAWHKENRKDLKTDEAIYAEMLHLSVNGDFQGPNEEILNGLSTFELAEILIKGYEVEQTPEEKLVERHSQFIEGPYSEGFADGIEFTLETLGIAIKGINDGDVDG